MMTIKDLKQIIETMEDDAPVHIGIGSHTQAYSHAYVSPYAPQNRAGKELMLFANLPQGFRVADHRPKAER